MPFNKYQTYLARIHGNKKFEDKRVSYKEYVTFHLFQKEIDQVKEHVNAFRFIDKKKFTDLVRDWERDFQKKNGRKLPATISEV